MSSGYIEAANSVLLKLLRNEPVSEVEVPEEMADFMQYAILLEQMQNEQKNFARLLVKGELNAKLPPHTNHLTDGLKQVHAQLRHLSWQAQCVAKGDYKQRVDFMGDFSKSFNNMVILLSERENDLKAQQTAMHMIFEKIEAGIAVMDQDQILYRNLTSERQFSGQTDFLAQATALPVDDREHQVQNTQTGRWYSVTNCYINWHDKENARLFFCLDITDSITREAKLKEAVFIDGLTGVMNRLSLDQNLEYLWGECLRSQHPLSLIMFDVDHFKEINDMYGHQQGDACLQMFAGILKDSALRSSDVVARYGGEEFVVLLPHAERNGALRIAEQVRQKVEQMHLCMTSQQGEKKEIGFTVSGGVCTLLPDSHSSPAQQLAAADRALYQAKDGGRNRICYQDVEHR